ncbi:antigen 5 like allergen Cul n 1-like [Malaya genurostris]|uniref:antigen 5 like allergen Cul n 1-like n=1 Tax=Malaya genurostris TaxID=325434 RepID=UPI0026F401F9|nr:antigen 5 like allergen Cul n 1-like [Malaya genurostris]
MKFIVAVVLLALTKSSQQVDYCSSSLCKTGTTHIACNGLTTLSSTCGTGAQEVVLNSTKQELILDLHNQLRSKIATGKQNYSTTFYPQAARMGTMVWSSELANIAAANARRCVYGHDKCRNTATLKTVGQNIARQYYYGMNFTDTDLIKGFVNAWYAEAANGNKDIIASYPDNYTGPVVGHFTQVVADRATQIGCSLVSYITSPWTNQLFVCNYAITNIIGQPVYQTGTKCSKCTTGCNAKYDGLCSLKEVINSNPY